MGIPLIPLLGAGASILGNVIGAGAQKDVNQAQLAYNREMYGIQRRDALADWTMQNEYNSPASQMKRLRDAGLNPNLVYGSGATATSQTAPRSVNAESWRPEAYRPDLSGVGQSLMGIYDVQMREAQTDNLKAQTTVATQEAALKAAQIANVTQSTSKSEFDLQMARDLRLNSLEMAASQLKKLQIDTGITLEANERAAAQNSASLMEAAERILTMRVGRAKTDDERRHIRAQIESIRKDVQLKSLDINLKKMGIQPGDNIALRMLGQLMQRDGVRPITKEDWKPGNIPDSTLRAMGLGDILDGGDPYRRKNK